MCTLDKSLLYLNLHYCTIIYAGSGPGYFVQHNTMSRPSCHKILPFHPTWSSSPFPFPHSQYLLVRFRTLRVTAYDGDLGSILALCPHVALRTVRPDTTPLMHELRLETK
jgi:hypothetical protein